MSGFLRWLTTTVTNTNGLYENTAADLFMRSPFFIPCCKEQKSLTTPAAQAEICEGFFVVGGLSAGQRPCGVSMASITFITVRCCVLGSALMRSTCRISLGAGLRLRAAVCGLPISSSTLAPSMRANSGSAGTGTAHCSSS